MLAVQFVGVPCTVAFGWLASRSTTADFFALCLAVGTVQGGAQALSRSSTPCSKSSRGSSAPRAGVHAA